MQERQQHPVSKNIRLELTELVSSSSDYLSSEVMKLFDEHSTLHLSQIVSRPAEVDQRNWLKRLFEIAATKTLMPDSRFKNARELAGDKDTNVIMDFNDSLAGFILDHQYHCNRPIYYRYFADRYGDNRLLQDCNGSIPFLVPRSLAEPELIWVDPASVSSIHLLFAGEGKAMMSQFGHVMFRLVICPDKDKSHNECDRNLYQHLVVGYRAHIDESTIDTLDGLFGGYRAYLFVNRFMDVYQEYAIGEFRELYSLPLLLSDDERKKIVRGLSEVHWSYAGEYKFLTNNCSTLAQKFLLNNWSEFSKTDSLQSLYWRPDSFFASLQSTKLSATSKINDLKKAEREGFYFSSTSSTYEKAFQLVKMSLVDPRFNSLDEYLKRNPILRLRDTLNDRQYYQALWGDQKLLSGQILLEELAVIRSEQRLLAEMAYFFDTNNILSVDIQLKESLDEYDYKVFSSCILKPITDSIKPIRRRNGIPMNLSKTILDKNTVKCGEQVDTLALKRVVRKIGDLDRSNWGKVESLMEYWANSINNISHYTDIEMDAPMNSALH